jgi:outer membrane receptor for ferrienterochelin and colicins
MPAQDPEPGDAAYLRLFYSDSEVVSASKASQKIGEAPAKIVVVSAEQIRDRGYVDLEEILHDLAGFDFNKGMGVDWSTIFMRGIRSDNSDRFLLIWDGVIQNDVWKQNNWLSRQYPLSNIQRIEVMYGPSSLLYGANAFAGIINIILKREKDVDGVSVWGMGGSFTTRMFEFDFGKEAGPWRFMANGRFYASDEMDFNGKYWVDRAGRKRTYNQNLKKMVPGYSPTDLADLDGDGYYEVSTDGRRTRYDGRTENPTSDWFLQAGLGYGDFNLRAYAWRRDEAEDPWYTSQKRSKDHFIVSGNAVDLTFDRPLSQAWSNHTYAIMRTSGVDPDSATPSFKAYFTNDANDPRDLSIYSLGSYTYYHLFAREYRLGTQFNFSKGDKSAILGAEYTRSDYPEDYSTRTLTWEPWNPTGRHDERNLAAFANAQAKIGQKFSVAGGLRFDHNSLAGESGGFGNLVTGRAAAIFAPDDRQTLKLIYGQSFQEPDPWHKFSLDRGIRDLRSPELKPEKLRSLELDYDFGVSDRWRGSIALYRTRISDLIRLVDVPYGADTTNQFKNIGELEVRGLELESRCLLSERTSLFVNATATTSKDPQTGRKTGDIAPFKANAGLEASLGRGWSASLRAHWVCARDTVNFDSDSIYVVRRVDAYVTADLALRKRDLAPGLDLTISLYNLFNVTYYDPGPRSADGKGYNGATIQEPFHVLVGLTYRF